MRRLRQLRTLALYIAIPAVSAVTPLVVLPALTTAYGAPGLASIAIGQSLGASAAVIAELGWSVLGPQLVAKSSTEQRRQLYRSAFATRLTALAVVAPIAVIISFLLAPDFKWAAAIIALGLSLSALSPSWFLIGTNRPLLILATEAGPRLLLSVLSAMLLLTGAPLLVYGAGIAVAAIITWLVTARVTQQALWPSVSDFREGRVVILRQFPLTFGRIVSVLYTSLPVTIVALVSPSSTATFAAIDRLLRMATTLLGAIPTRLQSWVGADPHPSGRHRSRQSLVANACLGFVSGLGFAVLAPFVGNYVFSGVVTFSPELTALAGAVIFAICTSRGFGLSLVAEGKANWIAAANIGAAAVGVTSIYLLGGLWGADGAVVGELAAEIVGLAIQALILFTGHRWIGRRKRPAS